MKMEKTRETTPGTLPETKRIEEMMMEQNVRIPGTKKSWWNKTVSWKSWEPHSVPEPFGQQAPEPQPEPWNDDGTGCQKSMETSPGTLAGTRKGWWNRMPKEYREASPGTLAGTRKGWNRMPGKDDGTGCQKSRETSPWTLAGTRKGWCQRSRETSPGTRKWWWNRIPEK